VDLTGVQTLALEVGDANDGVSSDHADWANAKFETVEGAQLATESAPPEEALILTPKPSPKPRITGAPVFGVHPGNPFLFTITATGDRPMKFSVSDLPAGLQLDPVTGQITGLIKNAGEYEVTLHAKNHYGRNARKFKIVCGSTIGLTPALGWNSWNCFASAVSADKVEAAADAMVASGLINHGWTYINIDDFWETHRNSDDPTLQGPHRDASGYILPNSRFPDMKRLADYVHAKGLKIGLYSSPGPWTCGGCTASWQHEDQDAQSYAQWGFDYLKYDWCSYGDIVHSDHSLPTLEKPYQVMRAALDKQPRDILFSFCQYGMGEVWKWGGETGGNSWRTTGDIVDTWTSMSANGFSQNGHEKYVTPGHFNDPDMLVVGKVGWGPQLHQTRLTPNEQYTHISLWCLQSSPLLIGCDMTQLDDFTLNLLSNDEVLAVDQDPLCKPASRIAKNGDVEIWGRELADGSKAVGIFNRGEEATHGQIQWADLGLRGKHQVRDLWRQKDLGKFTDAFPTDVPRHGVVLIQIR
jgi:alpha-galactosidase